MHTFKHTYLTTSLLFGMSISAAQASPLYTITDLGNGTGRVIIADGLNASGQVVGMTSGYTRDLRAFLYSNGELSYLHSQYGDSSRANGINDSGKIVGNDSEYGGNAFLYSNGVTTYSPIPHGIPVPYAIGINNPGQILLDGDTKPFLQLTPLLNTDVIFQPLGLTGTGYQSFGTSLNDSGDVVGWTTTSDNKSYAFLTHLGVTTNLGSLDGGATRANGINASGQIVGTSYTLAGTNHAFLYSNGVMHDLGTLGGTTSFSVATAINDTGDIVGITGVDSAHPRAMLYKSGAMMDLNTLVDPVFGVAFTAANAINAGGQILVTDASNHSYLLTPNVTIGTAPATAPHVVASPISTSKISVTWMPVAGATSYSVFRGTISGGPYSLVGTVSDKTIFSDTTVQSSMAYYYVVKAVNSHGTSAYSNQVATGTTVPGPISNLKATSYSQSKILLTWNRASNATGYEIYRSDIAGGFHRFLDGTINQNYTDAQYIYNVLTPSTSYYYIVVPVNAIGVGPKSPEVAGKTTPAISVKSLTFAPPSVVGGSNVTATLTLTGPAPVGNADVKIGSYNPAGLDAPGLIRVNAGATSCTFTIHSNVVTTPTYCPVTVSYGQGYLVVPMSVYPSFATAMSYVGFDVPSVNAGAAITGTLALNGPAPSTNAVVSITSSNPAALYVPSTAQFNSGLASRTFTAYARPVTSITSVTVTATWGRASQTTVVTVHPAVATAISSVAFSPTSAKGGTSLTGTLTLNSIAPPSNAVVQITSSNSSVLYVPPTAQLNAGLASRTFTAYSRAVTTSTNVTVTATYGGVSKTTIVTVTP